MTAEMTTNNPMRLPLKSVKLLAACCTILAILNTGQTTTAKATTPPPVKYIIESHFGREVNETTGGNVCTKTEKCQPAKEGTTAGGYSTPIDVEFGENENIFIADDANRRVQELSSDGEFVQMFGKDVNSFTKGDVCTEKEPKECQAGTKGTNRGEAGVIMEPQDLAVDHETHRLYVLDDSDARVDEYSEDGEFLLTFGEKVNETTGGNICTKTEKCQAGERGEPENTTTPAFKFAQGRASLLSVGKGGLVYVGDEDRIQYYNEDGTSAGELLLPGCRVTAMVVGASGEVYVVCNESNVIREYDSAGDLTGEITLEPHNTGSQAFGINELALSATGTLAVNEYEVTSSGAVSFGQLITPATGALGTEFKIARVTFGGMAFAPGGKLYRTTGSVQEVVGYEPVPVAEATASSIECSPGPERETDATFDCPLEGKVNPEGVPDTEMWFDWGPTLGVTESTEHKLLCSNPCPTEPVAVAATLTGIRPNENPFYFRVSVFDDNVKPPESPLHSFPPTPFRTPLAPTWMGEPHTEFVHATSLVLTSQLNPENAETHYHFQYAEDAKCEETERKIGHPPQLAECPTVSETPALTSKAYGRIGVTQQVSDLRPDTVYAYQLVSESEDVTGKEHLNATGPEATVRTQSAPTLHVASSPASAIGATSATIAGTVDPGGQAATYSLELGVYAHSETSYGTVASGPTGSSTEPVPESANITCLQPGTAYASRISARYGNGTATGSSATSTPTLFETLALPSAIATPVPPLVLSTPPIGFPKPKQVKPCRPGYKRDRHARCVRHKSNAHTKKKPHQKTHASQSHHGLTAVGSTKRSQ